MRSCLRVLNVMQVCQIYRSSVMVLVCALIYMPICSTQARLFCTQMSALNIGFLYTRGTVQSEEKMCLNPQNVSQQLRRWGY